MLYDSQLRGLFLCFYVVARKEQWRGGTRTLFQKYLRGLSLCWKRKSKGTRSLFQKYRTLNHIWPNQVTTHSRPSTKISKYFVSEKGVFWMCFKFTFPKEIDGKNFSFPIFILRCWMIFHPLLKSESFTSSTIDHTFSLKRRDSAQNQFILFW